MKDIKAGFCGFWRGFNPEDNFFTNALRHHYNVTISDDPDYLFCSVFSNKFVYNKKAVRIFYTGECQTPDMNLFDYAMGIDYLKLGDRYCRLPHYLLYGDRLLRMAVERGGMIQSPEYKDKFCSFVYSNPDADPVREEFFRKLDSKHRVDSGGRYMNNTGAAVKNKISFERGYRFSIAFENCSYPGYITEKVIQSFAAGTVPVYWGDPEADKTLNPDAYINVNGCGSVDEAVERVLEIDKDKERYLTMLSQQIFSVEDLIKKQTDEYEAFLVSIIDRPKEEAFRRNRGTRGRNYEQFFERYAGIDEGLRSVKRLIRR